MLAFYELFLLKQALCIKLRYERNLQNLGKEPIRKQTEDNPYNVKALQK